LIVPLIALDDAPLANWTRSGLGIGACAMAAIGNAMADTASAAMEM